MGASSSVSSIHSELSGSSRTLSRSGSTHSASELTKEEFAVIRLIYSSDFSKSAYINFLRHDEESNFPNYFRNVNFFKIGTDGDAVSEVLSDSGADDYNYTAYSSVETYFYNLTEEAKREIYSYQGGKVKPFLVDLKKASNYALLLMTVDSIGRFQKSASYLKWIETEKESPNPTFSISNIFSKHFSSRQTQALHSADDELLQHVLQCNDWLHLLKECVTEVPIATAICRYYGSNAKHKCRVVHSNDPYNSMFDTSAIDLYGKDINLLRSCDCAGDIESIVHNRSSSKLIVKMKIRGSETMIAVSTIPVSDMKQQYWYMLFVCCNLSAASFTMDELKIVSDFADVLPRSFSMRSPLSQEKVFPPPAIDVTEEGHGGEGWTASIRRTFRTK